jgi:hypothetical protein
LASQNGNLKNNIAMKILETERVNPPLSSQNLSRYGETAFLHWIADKILTAENFFSFSALYQFTGYQQKNGNLPIFEVKKVLFTPPDGVGCQNKYYQKFPLKKLPRWTYKNCLLVPTTGFAEQGGLTLKKAT